MAPVALRIIFGIVSSGSVFAQVVPSAVVPPGVKEIMEFGLTGAALTVCWVLWRALAEERKANAEERKASAAAMTEEREANALERAADRERTAKAIDAKDTQILEMAKQVTQLLSAFSELRGEVKDIRDRDEHMKRRA